MTDRNLSALLGLVLAPKGEAAPTLALEGPGRPRAASPTTWGGRSWPRHEAVRRVAEATGASQAAPRGGGLAHGLGLLIRRRSGFAVAPVLNPVPAPRAKRRQLTVRLPFDQFHRLHDLARRGGHTYQDILATATHACLERFAPRR